MTGLRLLVVLTAFNLWVLPAAAAPVIQSYAFAESAESGEDPGFENETASSEQAGESITAGSSRCPGTGSCVSLPGTDLGAHASAETSFGTNRASSHGNSGPENVENDVVDYASASSFWADEWTFDVAPANVGDAVLLEFRIDGSWGNNGYARFDVLVGTPSNDPPDPENPNPFPVNLEPLTGLAFETTAGAIFVLAPPGFIPVEDGGEPSGSIDQVVILSFVPEDGVTYTVAALLQVESLGEESDQIASFDSTAQLTRVFVPDGTSFSSAAGASYDVVVPEPGTLLLLALGAGALALARRR